MIVIITGASHTGKTLLAQRILEEYHYPYLSMDHLKMGLIRSRYTHLTAEDDEALTAYLWPVVREMIKTAAENRQDLTVEGCYVPFDWRKDLPGSYLRDVRFICLAMTDRYIDSHFDDITVHACDIEWRGDDTSCSPCFLKAENRRYAEGFRQCGEEPSLIDGDYGQSINEIIQRTFCP